jgi:hypothetical protein
LYCARHGGQEGDPLDEEESFGASPANDDPCADPRFAEAADNGDEEVPV